MAIKKLKVAQGFRFYRLKKSGQPAGKGFGAGTEVEVDTESEDYKRQQHKFVQPKKGEDGEETEEETKTDTTQTDEDTKGAGGSGGSDDDDDDFPVDTDGINVADHSVDYLNAWAVSVNAELPEDAEDKEALLEAIKKVIG